MSSHSSRSHDDFDGAFLGVAAPPAEAAAVLVHNSGSLSEHSTPSTKAYGHPNPNERMSLLNQSQYSFTHNDLIDNNNNNNIAVVDPAKRNNSGIPAATYFILGMELCERLCFYGATLVFQLYCLNMLQIDNAGANAVNNSFQFWAYLTPLIGGYVADSYWGKYKTILVFGTVYLIGMITLTLSAVPFVWKKFPTDIGDYGVLLFALALFLVGLGTGGIKSNVSTLIADQLDNSRKEDVEKVYRWFYWCINLGSIVGMAATPSLHEITKTTINGTVVGTSFWLSFLVPACFFVVALAIFFYARNMYVVRAPEGSLLSNVFRLFKSAWSRRNNSDLKGLPFIFKADTTRFKKEFVIQVAQAFNVCRVFCFFPIYWLLYNQMSTNFITQGEWLERPGWLTADQLNLVDAIVIVIMIPVMDKVLPILRRKFGWTLGPLQRIAIGFVIAGFGFIYVGVLQWEVARRGTWVGKDQTYVLNSSLDKKVSVWYQLAPYLFIGISEIFSSISSLEFAYAKAPVNMKAIVMSLNLLTTAVGSAIGLVMAPIFTPQNLMATFFAFSAGMLLLAVIFFKYFNDEDFDVIELPPHLEHKELESS